MRSKIAAASFLPALLALPAAAQGPDVLVPSGSLDGIFALVDRDKDGKYTTDGEAWDWRLDGKNSSPRSFVRTGGRIYWIEPFLDAIFWTTDPNGNGQIEDSERMTFVDTRKLFNTTNDTPNWLALDGAGWIWWTNDGGTKEGIYRSKDMNNDGDAMDAGETVGAAVEPARPTVGNVPNTGAFTLFLGQLDSVLYDPSWKKGRFICEHEGVDQSIAFEDKNGDGDFLDAGEVYLFAGLYNGGSLRRDIHPDVAGGKLPSANEVRDHDVDTSGAKPVYYLLSADFGSTRADAAIIFRGVDGNNDGDVNDAGEVTVFWDGSKDSKGATKGYNFSISMDVSGGKVYALVELDGPGGTQDHEQLVMLEDKNNDGDANDAGETTVLWDLGKDKTHYEPKVLPAGTINAPSGLPGTYDYYGTANCRSSLSGTSKHNIQVGSDNFNDKPLIGKPFVIRTWGAAKSQSGLYGIGLKKLLPGFPLDAGGTCFVFMSGDAFGLNFTTNASGFDNQTTNIPNDPSLGGVFTYWQSAVFDPGAPAGLGFTTSDGVEIRFGFYSYSRN